MKKKLRIILYIDTARETDRQIIRGIVKYSSIACNWELYLKPLPYVKPVNIKSNQLWFKNLAADGIIVRGLENIDKIKKLHLPTVVSGIYSEEHPNLPCVKTDSKAIGKMAAEHLMNCGLRNFSYCGFRGISWSIARELAFVETIKNAGFQVSRFPLNKSYKKPEDERKNILNWVKNLPKPVGIMACNDDRGFQIIQICKSAGINVPQDAAIIGVDNDEFVCSISSPSMTSIAVNFEKAGFQAAEMLEQLIKNPSKQCRNITVNPMDIIARQSTDILAVQDIALATAVRFIRENAHSAIGVDNVVETSGLSRRVLEKRFRHNFNRSINQEIRRIRVSHIAKLLVETNLTVLQISQKLNYTDAEHIARYFRAEKKMSPIQYRKVAAGRQ